MEIHTCKNCNLIDQVIKNQTERYSILSEENVSLHNALILSREIITDMTMQVAKLRDGLVAERQRNLDLYIKQETIAQQGMQPYINVVLNARDHSKKRSDSVPVKKSSPRIEPKCMDIMDRQKQAFEDDLNLFQALSEKCIANLKEQLEHTHDHISVLFEMHELLREELFREKKDNVKFRQQLDDALDSMYSLNAKQMEEMKKDLMAKAADTANLHTKQSFNVLKKQLDDRDRLVTRLRDQQEKLEELVQTLQKRIYKEEQKHKELVTELKKQLEATRQKFSLVDRRRRLDAEGFQTDISNIRKELKKFKKELSWPGYEHKGYINIENLETQMNLIDEQLKCCYRKCQS